MLADLLCQINLVMVSTKTFEKMFGHLVLPLFLNIRSVGSSPKLLIFGTVKLRRNFRIVHVR